MGMDYAGLVVENTDNGLVLLKTCCNISSNEMPDGFRASARIPDETWKDPSIFTLGNGLFIPYNMNTAGGRSANPAGGISHHGNFPSLRCADGCGERHGYEPAIPPCQRAW